MDRIGAIEGPPDISGVTAQIEQLLDESVASTAYLMVKERRQLMDLSQIDWDAVKAIYEGGRKRTAAQKLRSMLSARIAKLTRLNPTRVDLYERFQKLLEDYNAGSLNVETYFRELVELSRALDEEEARAISQGLTEEQQAVFDLLTRPNLALSAADEREVKRVSEELLAILKRDKLVLDWRKEQQTRAAVRLAVEETLDRLPEKYTRPIYAQKCDSIYQHIFDSYWDDGHSVYDRAA
jgi:type I restriction enzyme R subunit